MDFLKPNFTPSDPVRIMYNLGAGLDIPTGSFVKGFHGEEILLGGLGAVTGISGGGNYFKSTLMTYMSLSAANKIFSTAKTSISTYDTESNKHEDRLRAFTRRFDYLADRDLIADRDWVITNKTRYYGDKWFEVLKEFIENKKNNAKIATCTTPFLDRDKVSQLKILFPTISEIDSFSEFITSSDVKMMDENEIGDSGGNTLFARMALAKTRFMLEIPVLAESGYHFMLMTAQLNDSLQMGGGPPGLPPAKKLQHMKPGEKLNNATNKFYTALNNSWKTVGASVMNDSKTKLSIYPKDERDKEDGDTDLNLVSITQLRGKSGPSGYTLGIIVSQSEGVLPSLTEFHYIKEENRFGLGGNLQTYHLDLYPEVNLSRTTVRSKIDSDPKLRRALNITSELCQMHHFYRHLRHELPTPKDLFDKVKAQGYDWDMILGETRGWWTINDDNHPLKFLSTMDLCNIAKGAYKPWWAQ